MKDISKDVLARVEELSRRISALENEIALLKREAGSSDDNPVPLDAIDLDLDGISEDFLPASAGESVPVSDFVKEIDLPSPGVSVRLDEVEVAEEQDLPDITIGPDLPKVSTDLPEMALEADLPKSDMEPEVGEENEIPQVGFGLFGALEPETTARQKIGRQKKAVMDLMSSKEAWRSDMPGSPVKNIRSAISLNDRVMFIAALFRRDSVLFQDTLERLNAMESLGEVVKYLKDTFPEWAWGSETTYRFMMCVRRKIR